MTESPSSEAEAAPEDGAAELAAAVATAVGGTVAGSEFGTAKVAVDRSSWVDAITKARDEAGLDYFSFLSAIDWTKETTLGEGVEDPNGVEERYEVLCMLATLDDGRRVAISVDLPKDDASLPTLSEVFAGAIWHEREAAEMFGIDFVGHPNLSKLYLPDAFEGYPLRKSYPLLSREVKPWPGKVDVEDMPSTENPEAPSTDDADEGGDA